MTDRSSITLVTFGFKYGPPPANHYFDVSFVKNPARDARFGLFCEPNDEMRAFVMEQPAARGFVAHAVELIAFLAEQDDGLRIGLGCNAGRHRSVLLAEALADALIERGFDVVLVHRERDFADQGSQHRPEAAPIERRLRAL